METYQIKNCPKRSPLGSGVGNPFRIKPYVGYTDLFLGSLEDDFPNDPSQVCLGLLREQVPDIDVNQISLVDAIVVLLSIRIKGIGDELCMRYTCPCDEQRELIGGQTTSPHSLGSFTIRALPDDIPCEFLYNNIIFNPLKFCKLPELLRTPKHLMGTFLLGEMAENLPEDLSIRQGRELEKVAIRIHQAYGVENAIGFDCPCGKEWVKELGVGELEYFILGTIRSCRESDVPGSTERYLDKISAFLCLGELAPFKAVSEVKELSIASRNNWVIKLQKTYEEIEKARDKSKPKKR